ncbi:MAG: glycerophosphodiester phosphodiesterase [Aestuariibacter sp.]
MLVFAHRGASGEYPENTLPAFDAAIAQGADGIELDVFQVGDELLVYHDRYLDKLGFPDIQTVDLSPAQRAKLDIPMNKAIPTLMQALECINGRCLINIDIKYLHDVALLLECLNQAVARQFCRWPQIILSSFDHPLLLRLRQENTDINLGVILASIPLQFQSLKELLQPYSVHMDINCLDLQAVKSMHKMALPVYVYTVDKASDISLLKTWQVDGIFSNFPGRSKQMIAT